MDLKVLNLSFSYPSRPILNEITFEVKSGTILGIVGPNGAGKSTLIRTIAKNLPMQKGAVFLDKKDLSLMSNKELAQNLAVVPQEADVNFGFTVEEVVLMGRTPYLKRLQSEGKKDYEIAKEAMKATKVWDLRGRYITELSGGEKQRVILARALTQEPKILLLDEPTSHLDINHQMEMLSFLRSLTREGKLAAIMVLHDLNLAAQFCDELILLKEGRIYAAGKPTEVITPQNIKEVYQADVLIYNHPLLGLPQIILLEKRKVKKGEKKLKIHVVAGGGSGSNLMEELVVEGYEVTAGVLNIGDSDWLKAKELDLAIVAEDPFSPITAQKAEENLKMIEKADLVLLANIPFGPGNMANLEVLRQALAEKKEAIALKEEEFIKRDYTGGKATAIFEELRQLGLQEIGKNELLAYLNKLERRKISLKSKLSKASLS